MHPTDPTGGPTRCEVCKKAYALKQPDPDGGRRCFTHSNDPVTAAKREKNAATGAMTAARLQGVKPEDRKAVLAGVVDLDTAREKVRAEKKKAEEQDADPVDLTTKVQVQAFLGQAAGRLLAGGEPGAATAAAGLARVALAALGVTEETPIDEEVVGWRVERVDRNTKARADG